METRAIFTAVKKLPKGIAGFRYEGSMDIFRTAR
jgi:hypothetical protein